MPLSPAPGLTEAEAGADDQDRTGDLVLTKDVLCQLSYIGLRAHCASRSHRPPDFLQNHRPKRSIRRRMERETGIEPATNSLEGCDSTTELLPPSFLRLPATLASLSLTGGHKPTNFTDPTLTARWAPCGGATRLPRNQQTHQFHLPNFTTQWASEIGGEGRVRTSVALGRQIYSLLRLTTPPPPRTRADANRERGHRHVL